MGGGTRFCKDCKWAKAFPFFGFLCNHSLNEVTFNGRDLVHGPRTRKLWCSEARQKWRKEPRLFRKGEMNPCGPKALLFEPKEDACRVAPQDGASLEVAGPNSLNIKHSP